MLNISPVPYESVHKLEDSNTTTREWEEKLPKKERSSSNEKKKGLDNS